jgi:formate dehydrogenase major subunit
MTNGWVDMKNADMMLIMGGNPAENHPCGFKWAIEAKRTRNAKMIVVDPRFTRTASVADLYCQLRVATDIAFLGGMIRYAIENNRYPKEYLLNYTNAAYIVKDGFKLPENDGLYSGFDAKTQTYEKSTWNYAGSGGGGGKDSAQGYTMGVAAHPPSSSAPAPPSLPQTVEFDATLQNPNCVFQLLWKHYSRYTPEMVERITGVPKDQFLKVADLFTSIRKDGDTKKVGTIIYAVGWTQHTSGTQTIRTAAMLQLLLGNVGRAGGGVNALRGHSNIQGATDMAGIFENLPGYLKVPIPADTSLAEWMKRITPTPSKPNEWQSFNYWGNTAKFTVSLLKALYGDAATKQNDFAYELLPKVDRNYSWTYLWDNMYNGIVKGLFAFGMNGVAIGPDTKKNINALKKADWLVVGEIYPDETSEFWKSPGITTEEMKTIQTTVYRLPCAGFAEKDGTFTNSARWLQWKNIALPVPGNCRLDQAIVAQIFLKVRALYQAEGGKFPDPILKLTWNYTDPQNPSLAEVLKEINGKTFVDAEDPATKQQLKAGQQLPGFAWLKDDGTTSCGNWIYCGSYTEAGNLTMRRDASDPSGMGVHQNWAWSWPANRRVLYNRASCNVDGKPWDPSRRQVWWSESTQKWVGNDVPDFKLDSKPSDHMGPFIMNPEGVGRLFAPLGAFAEGPFPEFYEPTESPIVNLLHPKQSRNPVVRRFKTPDDKFGSVKDGFNVVCTTYRLTEHYHYWTKNNPMNVQLVPEPFIEIPEELAHEKGLSGGEKVKISSARGEYVAKAMVTKRIKSMLIDGKKTYQVGFPIHWGYRGIAEDEGKTGKMLANLTTPAVVDPNAYTPEFKGFLVKVEKA